MKKMRGVTTSVYSRKTLEKPKRQRSADFEYKGSGVVYARRRYYECAKHDFKIIYFPFYVYYFFGIDKGVALAPTYPHVR